MDTVERNEVALNVGEWAQYIRSNSTIRAAVKGQGRLAELAVSDGEFVKSSSGITHTEYLHLRTVWYRYHAKDHIQDFAKLLKNNEGTGYKGFVSPKNNNLAAELVVKMSPYLRAYLAAFQKPKIEPLSPRWYLHPSPNCGYFAMVRYWQAMVATHTKMVGTAGSKIVKHGVPEETRGRPTTPAGQHGSGGPSTAVTPPRQITSSGSPSKLETPAATSHPVAKGGVKNPASADEAYVNVAMLLLLQAITQEFQGKLSELHWVPPRMALHLAVPVFDATEQAFKRKALLEAQVDGYLCDGKDDAGLGRPMAICEAKSGTRRSIQTGTERQEAAEMAAWICDRPGNEGLLQSSNSGKKRRLMISQDRDDIYIIIGEYGTSYERYIRNAPWKVGDQAATPELLHHVSAPLAQDYEETLGSPTFLKLRAQEAIHIEGWEVPNKKDDGPPPPPGGPSGNGTNQAISGRLPVRTKTNKTAGVRPGTTSATTPQSLDLPTVDGFLVMHRFGPWKTLDASNMEVFVRRLLALMLQLKDNEASSPPSNEGPPATGGRASSTSGFRASSATGSRAPSATGNHGPPITRPPSATGNRPPSVSGNRTSSNTRGPSATGDRGLSATGNRPPSATGNRTSSTGSRASSASGEDRGRRR